MAAQAVPVVADCVRCGECHQRLGETEGCVSCFKWGQLNARLGR